VTLAANRIVVGGAELTWDDLPGLGLPSPAAVLVESGADALAAVREHALRGTELLVAAASRIDEGLREELRADGFAVVRPGGEPLAPTSRREPEPDRLWLLTSGSTGRPKRIGHTLGSLTTVRGPQAPRVWLCPYSPGTYAWWQVVTLSLTQPGQDIVVIEPAELEIWPGIAAAHGVTAASGTPTFWRQAIYRDLQALTQVPLAQITLGGEPVDQAILDQLRGIFPTTRISWIYASSEVGASIVVHDGRAGFPREWLDRSAPDRPTISVDGDELVITSPFHGAGLDGPVHTGDRVEIVDDRVVITGRLDSDEINVGGSKISAGVVRNVLQSHPAVAWARVTSRRSPLVGRMVVAEVVLTAEARSTGAGNGTAPVDNAALVGWCATRLPDYGVPRLIRFLDEIPAKETLKSDV